MAQLANVIADEFIRGAAETGMRRWGLDQNRYPNLHNRIRTNAPSYVRNAASGLSMAGRAIGLASSLYNVYGRLTAKRRRSEGSALPSDGGARLPPPPERGGAVLSRSTPVRRQTRYIQSRSQLFGFRRGTRRRSRYRRRTRRNTRSTIRRYRTTRYRRRY